MQRTACLDGVDDAIVHMCTQGLKDPYNKLPMKKATRLLTNAPSVVRHFVREKCAHSKEEHQTIQGSTWMLNDNKQWVHVRRSEYAGGYTSVFAKNLLSCLKADCEAGAYFGDDDDGDDERASRDKHDEPSDLRTKRKTTEQIEQPTIRRPQQMIEQPEKRIRHDSAPSGESHHSEDEEHDYTLRVKKRLKEKTTTTRRRRLRTVGNDDPISPSRSEQDPSVHGAMEGPPMDDAATEEEVPTPRGRVRTISRSARRTRSTSGPRVIREREVRQRLERQKEQLFERLRRMPAHLDAARRAASEAPPPVPQREPELVEAWDDRDDAMPAAAEGPAEEFHDFEDVVMGDPLLQPAGEEVGGLDEAEVARLDQIPETVKLGVRRAHHQLGHPARNTLLRLAR